MLWIIVLEIFLYLQRCCKALGSFDNVVDFRWKIVLCMGVEWRLSNNFEHVLICWVEILLRFASLYDNGG